MGLEFFQLLGLFDERERAAGDEVDGGLMPRHEDAGVWVRSIRGRPELRDLRVYPLCAVEAGDADAMVAVFYEVEAAELVENNGGSSWPSRNARSMRFQRSRERVRSGMNPSSNQSCFPALPTMRDSSTVALPRRMPPKARIDHRCSSKERSVRVPLLRRNVARSPRILALRLAAVNSLSTCSSRLIRSTIGAVLFGTLVA